MSVISLLLDILIGGLLMANIVYCWVLNKRIKILQDGKSELANLLTHFDDATERASESIVALQTASKKIGENIQAKIDKVNFLIDDLTFMVEKGNQLADHLDANFAVNRARNRVLAENKVGNQENEFAEAEKMLEKNAAKTIDRSTYAKESSPPFVPEKISHKEKTTATLETVLGHVIGRIKPVNAVHDADEEVMVKEAPVTTKNKSRSKAEQELLEMIRGGIKG